VLTGIIGLSARGAPEAKAFADQLRQRIYALGEAHDFVRPHSHLSATPRLQGALSALIGRLMRPYNDSEQGRERIRFTGDDAAIDDAAATPLALLFHELATNAAKYGALSSPNGTVEVIGENCDDRYCITWRESGGPETTAPSAVTGFGSKLVEMSVQGQMRGEIEREWRPEGLEVRIALPRDALSRSSSLHRNREEL
jgi:two-component sensor histidine kinase